MAKSANLVLFELLEQETDGDSEVTQVSHTFSIYKKRIFKKRRGDLLVIFKKNLA